jgi:predicted nucleotidyltransferase
MAQRVGANAMKKQQALNALIKLKPELVKRFGVTRLALFGSTVRDEARPESDIDIVVAFDSPATSAKYFGVQFYLEDELGVPVDLADSSHKCNGLEINKLSQSFG